MTDSHGARPTWRSRSRWRCSPARPTRRARVLAAAIAELPEGRPPAAARGPAARPGVVRGLDDRGSRRSARVPGEARGRLRMTLMTTYAAFDWAHRCGPPRRARLVLEALPVRATRRRRGPGAGGDRRVADAGRARRGGAPLGRRSRRPPAGVGSVFGSLGVHVWRGWTLLMEGELEGAESELLRAASARRCGERSRARGSSQAVGRWRRSSWSGATCDEARAARVRAARGAVTFGGIFRDRAEIEMMLADRRYEEAVALALDRAEQSRGGCETPRSSLAQPRGRGARRAGPPRRGDRRWSSRSSRRRASSERRGRSAAPCACSDTASARRAAAPGARRSRC